MDDDRQTQLTLEEPVKGDDDSSAQVKKKGGVISYLRNNLLAGVLFVAPLLITFYVIRFLVGVLDNALSSLIPEKYSPTNFLPYDIFGMEIVVGLILLIFIGIFARNFVGQRLLSWWEKFLKNIPGVRTIYGATKQIIETVTSSSSDSFREVVMVEYPRKNSWAIAFVTGKTQGEVQKLTDSEMINVFLPTTPNPTSGFLLFVPKKDLIPLHMTVDQGIKMVISAGIVTPSLAEGKAAVEEASQNSVVEEEGAQPKEK